MKKFLCVLCTWFLLCGIPVCSAQAQANPVRPTNRVNRLSDTSAHGEPTSERTTATPTAAKPKTSVAASSSNNSSAEASAVAPTAASTASAVNTTISALTDIYRVGVGDVLDIRVLNHRTRESTLYTVTEGGVLEFPLAGEPLFVAGMTTDEIDARLSSELKRRAVLTEPQVVVGVREYRSHTIVVSGLVHNPGIKILRREAMPLYALLAEAQPRPDAGRVTVMSGATQQSSTFSLGDASVMNRLAQAGDVITVEARPPQFYFIGGQVLAPGQKDFHQGLTLTQAILASGGKTRFAGTHARILRTGTDGHLINIEFNLKAIEAGKTPDPNLQPGDRVELSRRRW